MKKRLMSFLLCFAMLASMLPMSVQAAAPAGADVSEIPTEGDVWDGSITEPSKLVQKDGVYYYEITKCSELAYVAQTGGDWLTYNYILGNNLILNDVELTWNDAGEIINSEDLKKWVPIPHFTGSFDGDNYLISGTFIVEPYSYSDITTGFFDSVGGSYSRPSEIKNLSLVNSYIKGEKATGGLVSSLAYTTVSNCSFSGYVSGGICGGIACQTMYAQIEYCNVSGVVISSGTVGGLCARMNGGGIANCHASCDVFCTGEVAGGLVGESFNNSVVITNSSATGNVFGNGVAGGFIGCEEGYSIRIDQCFSAGVVTSDSGVAGGFIGKYNSDNNSASISNCYSVGDVYAATFSGGFVGSCAEDISFCYSLGKIVCGSGCGGFMGEDRQIWGETFTVKNCYYLKDINCNNELFGTSTSTSDTVGEIEGKSSSLLKIQSTFADWDFTEIWSISADKNGGYPYLQWQEGVLSDIAVNGVQISEKALSLAEGDYVYLSAIVSPANATNKSVTWSSSDSGIATVTTAGKVTAISPGTATITAATKDGGYTATCTVTVTERIPEEYRINSITVRDDDGAVLSELPVGSCLATVSITNVASEGNTLVFLASYTAEGQYQGMMWVSVEDLPIGATIKITLPVDNSGGNIANLTAFVVASFSNLTPLGGAVSFLPQ